MLRATRKSKTASRHDGGRAARPRLVSKTHPTKVSSRVSSKTNNKTFKNDAKSDMQADPSIGLGVKIKHGRMVRGLTLKELADEVGCSESMLSKIENDRAAPSFGMLHRVATALGTNISELYSAPREDSGVVSRDGERPVLVTDNLRTGKGIHMERLIPYSREHLLQGNIHRIAPGGGSEAISHAGEEIGYVLEGEIELVVDGKKFLAGEGDSFHFRSELPHSYRNVGKRNARVLWVSTPPTF